MKDILVVDSPEKWPISIPGVTVVGAREYITDRNLSAAPRARVYNLCQSYKYQTRGYYVSLLAEARGHRPMPRTGSTRDFSSLSLLRVLTEDLDDLIQKSLEPVTQSEFVLSVYFGHNTAKRYERLAQRLFAIFGAPLLRARFVLTNKHWQLQHIAPVPTNDIPTSHHSVVVEAATDFFSSRRTVRSGRKPYRYDLAILHNPADDHPPSNKRAMQKFTKAAEELGFRVELLTKDDYSKIPQFDALFIRETTFVMHHTYRFARRAAAEGIIVIDDPQSIIACTNKVYQAELAHKNHIRTPLTVIVDRESASELCQQIPYPIILKRPDSSFSQGVIKVSCAEELDQGLNLFFKQSELVVAQSYLVTDFDWRVGIIDGKILYVCKYHMAQGHWQIIQTSPEHGLTNGKVEVIPPQDVPAGLAKFALKAAATIGNGLYGVDIKESHGHYYLIEINDNPSIDSGYEDQLLKDDLYSQIMQVFLARIENNKKMVGI